MKIRYLQLLGGLMLAGALAAPVFVCESLAAPRVTVGAEVGIELPRGAISVRVGGERYHYHDGRYYRKSGHKYVLVEAPRGALIRDLPRGYNKIVLRGRTYYRYRDVYYERGPRGFVVVEVDLDSEKEAPPVVASSGGSGYLSVWRGDEELRFKEGQFFRSTSKGLVWVEAPLGGLALELPEGVTSVWYEKIEYFESDGVYFRKTPDGYRVVAAPWSVLAEDQARQGAP